MGCLEDREQQTSARKLIQANPTPHSPVKAYRDNLITAIKKADFARLHSESIACQESTHITGQPPSQLQVPIELHLNLKEQWWTGDSYNVKLAEDFKANQWCLVFTLCKPKKGEEQFPRKLMQWKERADKLTCCWVLKILNVLENESAYYFLTEVCSRYRLRDYIHCSQPLEESTIMELMQELLLVVSYCHSRGVVLRNLSLNTLVFATNPRESELKMKVFDLSESVEIDEQKSMNSSFRASHFVAPEVWSGPVTTKSDIWSCGVIAYFLVTGRTPFTRTQSSGTKHEEVRFDGSDWQRIGPEVKELIARMLHCDPESRPSAIDLLSYHSLSSLSQVLKGQEISAIFSTTPATHTSSALKVLMAQFIIAQVIRDEPLLRLLEAMKSADSECDGVLTKKAIVAVLKAEITDAKRLKAAERIVETVGVTASGRVDYTDFVQSLSHGDWLFCREYLAAGFSLLERDGKIALLKLKTTLDIENGTKAAEQWETITAGIEEKVNFEEFTTIVQRIARNSA